MNARKFSSVVLAAVALLLVASAAWGQVQTQTYFVWDTWGYQDPLRDANKIELPGSVLDNTEDDLMCWAAAASNILDWGGWDAPGFTSAGQMFQHFQDHWTDLGGLL